MLSFLKTCVEHVPYCAGRWLARVPFRWRLGGAYDRVRRECLDSLEWEDSQKEEYALARFKEVFEYAKQVFPCYRELYERAGVLKLEVRSLADVSRIPMIDKAWVREHFREFQGAFNLNTGGTSGNPMTFYVDKNAWAREWGHMHCIWEKLGYDYRDIKLTLRGRSRSNQAIAYNPVHNEFIISPYLPVDSYKDTLVKLCRKSNPKWFHGYPSVIYQFILELETSASQDEIWAVLGGIKGAFLSSEFPMPYMMEKFKKYGIKCVSWYGHSEMCILAYDFSGAEGDCTFANRYKPFTTYGLCEIDGGRLLGTSFHNHDMPLIRYDTGDIVEATDVTGKGLIKEFAITEGRCADFIYDRNGKKVSVNSLIIGRHHHACDVANYIQITQPEPGKAVFLLSTNKQLEEPFEKLFDIPFIDMEFSMKVIREPIRTAMGKLKMRV